MALTKLSLAGGGEWSSCLTSKPVIRLERASGRCDLARVGRSGGAGPWAASPTYRLNSSA